MLWNAVNGKVQIDRGSMSYVSFGHGKKSLIILPGLSDGLTTVKGKALLLAKPYQLFFEKYTVYMFSRRDELPEHFSIRNMADDQAAAIRILGLEKVSVLGVSQGGMIALSLAINYPELTDRLVIAVSSVRCNETIKGCLSQWISDAEREDHKQLMIDTAEKSYSQNYLKAFRKTYPVIGAVGKPSDHYKRFMVNAEAILGCDVLDDLHRITCPVLIIGGADDKVVGIAASYEMKDRISGSELYVYPGLGHALYEEAKDFNQRVFGFLEKES